jgi:hypothetical protein
MNRQQRRAAVKQARQQKSGISKVVLVHEAGHAVARYITAAIGKFQCVPGLASSAAKRSYSACAAFRRSFYVQVIRNGFLSLLALGALTLEGHAQKTLVAALECDFPLVSNGALELAASTLQYYIDTATGWRVNEDSFSFDGPANIIVGGKDRVVSLSITISRHSGKATKTLSSEGKSLTVSGECKKMESSGPKF